MTRAHTHLAAKHMVDQQLRSRGVHDQEVLAAMEAVPRHRFAPDVDIAKAYSDGPLPTLSGQTISQPYMVAHMTELLGVEPGMKVLEVGTGSGYQTAVLVHLGVEVFSIERHSTLATRAKKLLEDLNCLDQVTLVEGDGTLGLPEIAPFDRIIVTAAAPSLPTAMREQLAEIGRIVIPIGTREGQRIYVYKRHGAHWSKLPGMHCKFVPLVGEDGWDVEVVTSP